MIKDVLEGIRRIDHVMLHGLTGERGILETWVDKNIWVHSPVKSVLVEVMLVCHFCFSMAFRLS